MEKIATVRAKRNISRNRSWVLIAPVSCILLARQLIDRSYRILAQGSSPTYIASRLACGAFAFDRVLLFNPGTTQLWSATCDFSRCREDTRRRPRLSKYARNE